MAAHRQARGDVELKGLEQDFSLAVGDFGMPHNAANFNTGEGSAHPGRCRAALDAQGREESLLRDFHAADLLHAALALLLLLQKLLLTRDVSAVALGGDVLAVGADRLAGYDP